MEATEILSDSQAMEMALRLALRGTGTVSPNPRVGCVILKDGRLVGAGWHQKFGEPHAETNALSSTPEDLTGAELFVTLEPCSHTGKTPPCVDAIITRGIKRVVIGMLDPNPNINGTGVSQLRDAGIDVEVGLMEAECGWINRFFAKHITSGMPYVVAKVAQSIDGTIALANGESKWITGEESRRRVHILRSEIDAVLIGKNTAEKDDPRLTVREIEGRNPYRVVLDADLALPFHLELFNDANRLRTIVICDETHASSPKAENFRLAGVQVVSAPTENKVVLPATALRILSERFSIGSVLVEGGAGVYSSFAQDDLIDELHVFVAPIVIGKGLSAFDSLQISNLSSAKRFRLHSVTQSGEDAEMVWVK